MRAAPVVTSLLVLLSVSALGGVARAQDHDATFCSMLSAIGATERVGDVASGTVSGTEAVVLRRRVVARSTYVLLVSLSGAATDASISPVARAGDEAPHREGMRIAHDFSASTSGAVAISFRAPPGTAYHAALYRLTPPREPTLGVRPFAMALQSGGTIGSLLGEPPRPPDCRPAPVSVPGSGGRSPEVRLGRIVIRGSIPRAEITRVLTDSRAQLASCATSDGAHDVVLQLVVSPTGTVQTASADAPAPLSACITRAARRWRFPSTGAGVTAVEVPLSFDTPR